MRPPIAGVICAMVSAKRILLYEMDGEWVLPTDDIEGKEQPKDAAVRVMQSLTGKDCSTTSVRGLISSKETDDGSTVHKLLHLCLMKGRVEQNKHLKYFAFNKLAKAKLGPGVYEIVHKMIINLEATYYECIIDDGVLEHFAPL